MKPRLPLVNRVLALALFGRLGQCPRCTNAAFVAFALVALGTCALAVLGVALAVVAAAASLTLLLAALWISHVFMFTLRSARATARASGSGDPAPAWTRRRLIAAFLRVLAFSAMAASLPRGAFGQSCNCYEENDCYCPPEFPNCIYNPTTREAICCGPDTNGCAGPYSTWCCPPGSNCYGTDNQCY